MNAATLSLLCGDREAATTLAGAVLDHLGSLPRERIGYYEIASEIEEMGCFLKDVDQGLIDFPFLIDASEADEEEQVVFLCWQYGEPQVVAWHAIDSGFSDRHPLPGASKPLLN